MEQLFGWIATVLFSLMLIPQIIKTIRTKGTKEVSILMFSIYLIANMFAFAYAYLIMQDPLLIKYFIGIVTAIFYIIVYVHFRRSDVK